MIYTGTSQVKGQCKSFTAPVKPVSIENMDCLPVLTENVVERKESKHSLALGIESNASGDNIHHSGDVLVGGLHIKAIRIKFSAGKQAIAQNTPQRP